MGIKIETQQQNPYNRDHWNEDQRFRLRLTKLDHLDGNVALASSRRLAQRGGQLG